MMIKEIKILFFGLICIITACEKTETTSMKGNAIGYINLIDDFGNEIFDKSGVKVSINGSSHSIVTDITGRFDFNNLSAGTYDLWFEKEGFGTYKLISWQFVGGALPALINIDLFQIPTYEIENLNITFYQDIKLEGRFTKAVVFYLMRCYIKTTSDVSNINYDFVGQGGSLFSTVSKQFDYTIYNEGKIKYGDKIYIAIYLYNWSVQKDYGYYDPEKDIFINPTAKKAFKTIEFICQ